MVWAFYKFPRAPFEMLIIDRLNNVGVSLICDFVIGLVALV